MDAIQKTIAKPLTPRAQRLIYGNSIKLRLICWIIGLFPEPVLKNNIYVSCERIWETEEQKMLREHNEAKELAERREKHMQEQIVQGLNKAIETCQDVAADPPKDLENLLPLWDDCSRLIHFAGVAARLSDQSGAGPASESCLDCLLDIDAPSRCVCDNTKLPPKISTGNMLYVLDKLTYDLGKYQDRWMKELRGRRPGDKSNPAASKGKKP